MMRRSIFLLTVAAALSGCASMNKASPDQTAGLQPTAYRVADDATGATEKLPAESKPVQIFWFLGGR